MASQRKTSRTRAGKQRSLFLAILSGLGHLLRLFVAWVYRHARKNPLMACGFFLFLVGFGFVTFNALFYQSASHHAVFIQTRPLAQQISAPSAQSMSNKADHAQEGTVSAVSSSASSASQTQPSPTSKETTLPDNLLDAQKMLAAMGLYDGPLDGLDGPKTRNAIALWRQNSKGNGNPNRGKQQDDIASLISGALPKSGNVDQVTTQSLSTTRQAVANGQNIAAVKEAAGNQNKTGADNGDVKILQATPAVAASQQATNINGFKAGTADIMRVQAGLRAFGDDHVVVTGTEDENTAEALRNFQKMFSLTITGKINQEVIDKMKDIGLIG
ncbi:peptidoglycan-binding domain-containing protein [Bartonella apis]|uniref:peptidoglycan-binding domain-containing protein n=1 Tax=Bartonella apis TaxID=1686310 RepID=UPI00242CCB64|nr:peptidoglycan-binding domain-containing protein [Bartonella apis]